jgi:poly(A) polymerase
MFFLRKKGPTIRERSEHCISRKNIDEDALKVLYRLSTAGHIAYLVGGSVRDLLLGRRPKDFDVGTDARPNEIKKIFRNCFLIGRRFRLAHIIFGKKVIETSTFRRQPQEQESEAGNGLYQADDNTFGTPEEDAKRRDFTVNGLFYDIKTFSVIDYVGGLKDLEKKTLRCIGDPNIRFQEDPVRMMRAVKFAARLDFTIDRVSRKAILKHHAEILKASPPRVCEEVYRLFTYNKSSQAFHLLWELELLKDLLPELDKHIHATGGKHAPLWKLLQTLDNDPAAESASNGLRTACLYYTMYLEQLKHEGGHAQHHKTFSPHTSRTALSSLAERLKIPKMTFFTAATILDMQRRLEEMPQRGSRRCAHFVRHPDFLEALAFYRLVKTTHGQDLSKAKAWEVFFKEEWDAAHRHIDEEKINPESPEAEDPEAVFTVVAEDAPHPKPGGTSTRRRGRRRGPPRREHPRDDAASAPPLHHSEHAHHPTTHENETTRSHHE